MAFSASEEGLQASIAKKLKQNLVFFFNFNLVILKDVTFWIIWLIIFWVSVRFSFFINH